MNLVSKRNFVLMLAGVLVVAFGLMSLYLNDKKSKQQSSMQENQVVALPTLSTSDNVDQIENDLNNTDMQNVDKDLQDMEKEINTSF